MTTTTAPETTTVEEEKPPAIGKLLLKSATHPRDKAAVQALVDEGKLLERGNVRTALVVENEKESSSAPGSASATACTASASTTPSGRSWTSCCRSRARIRPAWPG